MNQFNAEQITYLSHGLVELDSVEDVKISLSNNDIGDVGVLTLAAAFTTLPSLHTLHLGFDSMNIGNSALTGCMNALGNSKTLKNLTVSLIHNKMKDEGVKALLEGFT